MAGSISAEEPTVTISSREMVVPATPTERRNFFLSCFDVIWNHLHYNQRVIFYENVAAEAPQGGGAAAARAVMEKLKRSLARCLVYYYPWSGRLLQGGRTADGRLAVDCNDAGVEVVEACVDLPISRLAASGFQMRPFFAKLCQHVDPSAPDSPLLSIQVTFFSDGGLALGISQSHVVADGQALWNFMVSWSECSRDLSLSLPPIVDREMLALPNPSSEKAASWKFNATKKEEEDDLIDTGEDLSSTTNDDDDAITAGSNSSSNLIQCFFIMPSIAIKQLKMEDGGIHTSYEVMCAHLWKHITIARQRPSHEPTFMFVLANCRTRLNPRLPSAFFGNVIGFDVTETKVGRICSETLHATACRIHDAVVTIVQDSLVGFMNWIEIPGNDLLKFMIPRIPKGKGINVASSPRFPAYEVDFGWGKPSAVRSPKVPGESEIVLFGGNPKLDEGDVEMCVCLPSDVLKRLLEDSTFLAKSPSSPFL